MGLVQAQPAWTMGVRRFNPYRDLASVTALLVRIFGEEMVTEGTLSAGVAQILRRYSSLAWLWLGFDAWFEGELAGFVWEEDGQIVGNATIAPVGSGFKQWVLSNVAVAPAYRGRGIATALVRACLNHASLYGADRILLQVWRSNDGAHRLYEREGFKPFSSVARLIFQKGKVSESENTGLWREYRENDWLELCYIAGLMLTRDAQILRTSPANAFRRGFTSQLLAKLSARTGKNVAGRLVLWREDKIYGGVTFTQNYPASCRLLLLLLPEQQETAAMNVALKACEFARREKCAKIFCDIPESMSLLIRALSDCGFTYSDSLEQMAMDIR